MYTFIVFIRLCVGRKDDSDRCQLTYIWVDTSKTGTTEIWNWNPETPFQFLLLYSSFFVYPNKTIHRSQVADKHSHILLYRVHLAMSVIQTRVVFESRSLRGVVIDTGCIGNCKSNYHIITTTEIPNRYEIRNNKNIYFSFFYALSCNFISESLTQSFIHRNGYHMIQNVSDIVVEGGGDCPEYSAAGILKGMSTFYAFCDFNQ